MFVALRERAEGIDGSFRWVVHAGHRVLERVGPHGSQLVVPPGGGLRQLLIEDVHAAGHLGVARMTALLYSRVYWPSLRADISKYVRQCEVCQKNKDRTQATPGLL